MVSDGSSYRIVLRRRVGKIEEARAGEPSDVNSNTDSYHDRFEGSTRLLVPMGNRKFPLTGPRYSSASVGRDKVGFASRDEDAEEQPSR